VRALEKALGVPNRTACYILEYMLREGLVKRQGSRWTGYVYTLTEGEASTTPAE
jgi:predicted DNA-binding transcriptional regulator